MDRLPIGARNVVMKFGSLPDIDAVDTDEDVWDGTDAYAWPAAAATMTVSSVSANDDGDPVGTGARTVKVLGLDANYAEVEETVTMNGQTGVALSTDLLRVYRLYVVTVGTVGTNDGNIWVGTGDVTAGVPATAYAGILAGRGQSGMAIYTVPLTTVSGSTITKGYIQRWYANVSAVTGGYCTVALQTRAINEGWRTRRISGVAQGAGLDEEMGSGIVVAAKTDIRIRVLDNGVNNSRVSAGFDIALQC